MAEQEKLGQIGVTQFRKDTSLRVAELDKEREIGEALAKFTKEAEIREQERLTRVRVASANAEAIKGENIAKEDIALSTSRLSVKQAQAYQESEIKKRQAEAAVREAQAIGKSYIYIERDNNTLFS